MRFSKFLACAASGVAVAGAFTVCTTDSASAKRAQFSDEPWGVIYRNTSGNPNAVLRVGPWGRTSPTDIAATQQPPFGIGSLGLIVGGDTDHIQFGNETDFAGTRLADINTLRYWIFTGVDVDVFPSINRPNLSLEIDPNRPETGDYSSLVYLPNSSTAPSAPSTPFPNIWQQYDASAAGSQWYLTQPGTLTTCTQANPCSFAELKALLPDAVITYSVAINKGSNDGPFHGAVDGLQINNFTYDFEPQGVRTIFTPVASAPSPARSTSTRKSKSSGAWESKPAATATSSGAAVRLSARVRARVSAGPADSE
ncbi:hypothetical protein GCM10010116_30580 [Microbispora rosea subsp. aerata]|nr:hypothetical protein [Microbispora rosea]GGO15241.1 hypothetical protein GCM10010116_30580 [Microbispora rosea subsp. aerata]GIH57540.1 hypothetical protein Mro02_44540 [Microbispora rosea subsp. aerata]GLJ85510.1 hypothetical protein GCM10017588_42430 [Microbispora rosea subsp. aerata]